MPSPFPGMDPYLEARWSDVHTGLCVRIQGALQPQLPPELRARATERVLLGSVARRHRTRTLREPVVVEPELRSRPLDDSEARPERVATPTEPIIVEKRRPLSVDRWVRVIDTTDSDRLVTAIEVLTPRHKRAGSFNRRYRRKLDGYMDSGVNIVELDLLRLPRKRLDVTEDDVPAGRRAPYYACVQRADSPDRWEVYPIALRQPLPAIPIPLPEMDVLLELQPILARVYEEGAHDDIDYREPPKPRLTGDDADWVDQLLKSAGRR